MNAEKYARIFTSQGFSAGDRVVVCASFGMKISRPRNPASNALLWEGRVLRKSRVPALLKSGGAMFTIRMEDHTRYMRMRQNAYENPEPST